MRPRTTSNRIAAALLAALSAASCGAAIPGGPAPATASAQSRDASLDDYRSHLTELSVLTLACSRARNVEKCDPSLVGSDDRVPVPGSADNRRLIRYGWLRVLFSKAQEADQPAPKTAVSPKDSPQETAQLFLRPTTTQLLQDAIKRLSDDLAESNAPAQAVPNHDSERAVMKQVLAQREFRNLEQPTTRDSMLEKIGNVLNRLFDKASRLKAQSAWIGRALVYGFILLVLVALAWALLQLERRWRVRLVPESESPAAGAVSARDWQLWLGDARRAAAAGNWREAIHFTYWASISRLESRRLWPADRARTPREYLALVGPDDPRRAGLSELTGGFERTWYGGRPAGEQDYRKAESLATALIAGGSSTASDQPAPAEGGAR